MGKTHNFLAVGSFPELCIVSLKEVSVFFHFTCVGVEDGVDGFDDAVDSVAVEILWVWLCRAGAGAEWLTF